MPDTATKRITGVSQKFSEKYLQGIEAKEAVYVLKDQDCPCLFVRAHTSGRKMLFYQFKKDGKMFRGNLGLVGQISLAEARKTALSMKGKVFIGESIEKKEIVISPKICDLFERYKKDHIKMLKLSTQETYHRYTEWIVSEYGDYQLSNIDQDSAKQIVNRYSNGKKVTANRFLATVRNAWNWGKNEGLTKENPFEAIRKFKETPRDERADEGGILKIIDAIQAEENPISRAYHLTILYTMCRRGEADKMKWRDLDGDIWTKPRENTKNSKPQRVFLVSDVMEAIKGLPRGGDDDLVFQNFQGWTRAWKRILTRAGLPYPSVRVHDLRRSVAAWLLTTNKATVQQISFILGHSSVAITQKVYAAYTGDSQLAALAIQSIRNAPSI